MEGETIDNERKVKEIIEKFGVNSSVRVGKKILNFERAS